MTPFDELTLGEVEELTAVCLNGKQFQDADPLTLAGAVMWMTRRKDEPDLEWKAFKATVRMAEIKEFSTTMDESSDPTKATTG